MPTGAGGGVGGGGVAGTTTGGRLVGCWVGEDPQRARAAMAVMPTTIASEGRVFIKRALLLFPVVCELTRRF
jgi:hypothetical protein